MIQQEATDITTIINKLEREGIITWNEEQTIATGDFSLSNHSHLLTDQELKQWLQVLHKGSEHNDQECSDLHRFRFEVVH